MTAAAGTAPAPRRGPRRRGEAAEHFRLMADSAPVMIWVASPDRRCVYVNREWLGFTGRALDEELGFGWVDRVHPEDRPRALAAYERAFEERGPFETEYRLRRVDGEYRWLIVKGMPLVADEQLTGFVGSCLDITDRMRAEQEARRREQDFKTLAENIPDVIARLDRELRCLYANRAAEQALGGPIPGRRPRELPLPEPAAAALEEASRRAFETGAEQPFQLDAATAHGLRHYEGRAIPERDAAGRLEAVLLIAYDVTARTHEDVKRAEALERERSARAHAEAATLARDQFLAIVSHELRSPLNGIKSWTHVLENHLRDGDPTVSRALAGIMIGVEHQVRLIDDLLDVTRAISGNLGLVKQPMPVQPALADAVESLRAMAQEKGLAIVTDYGIGEREIHGDPDRIRQVFVNLLTNAVKFTPAGGTITVSAGVEDDMARIEVRDDGAGVPPEFLPYLFDPFRQADQGSSKRGQQGLGLGLALVQRLAELHGGYVTCESEGVGRGATFRVYLPLRGDAGPPVVLERERHAQPASLPTLSGIRVLLIDDQVEARESVAALLAQAGAGVLTAGSGQEALAHLALAEPEDSPQVIVCDIAMPGEDGYATLKRIRAWESGPRGGRSRRPAIALSAFTQREDRIRALAEGFQMHLTKPVAPAELVTVISSVARGVRL